MNKLKKILQHFTKNLHLCLDYGFCEFFLFVKKQDGSIVDHSDIRYDKIKSFRGPKNQK